MAQNCSGSINPKNIEMSYKTKYYIALGCVVVLLAYIVFAAIQRHKLSNAIIDCNNKGQCIKEKGRFGYECYESNAQSSEQAQ